ncbi:MAG: hypothetical protein JJLCMIEE_02360 [Acidimicrobiales bacterium]|nr:hypothetical protein [Acidimicrobiales bacterium]
MSEVREERESGPAGKVRARPVTRDILDYANRVHAFLTKLQRSDLADRVTAEAQRWKDNRVTTVVAGDIKRGKSSLINSLLGRPGLLPVDADVATSVHLVVRHGEQLKIEVTRLDEDGEPSVEQIAPDELGDFASMAGDELTRRGVVKVEVYIDHPLLARGLAIIDTPGVGGMSRGHRDITMATLQNADVLVFTISAQEPVSRSELDFLAEASGRIDAVVFAITRSDANTDETNRAMLAENKEKLRAYRGTLEEAAGLDEQAAELARRLARLEHAPMLLTSAYLADKAAQRAELGREESAERYRKLSGLGLLEHALVRTIDNRENVKLANVLQLCSILTAEVEAEQQTRVRASEGDHSIETELEEKQAELEAFMSQQARWRTGLGGAIQRLQAASSRRVSRELTVVRNHYREILESARDIDALSEILPQELEYSLHGAWNTLAAEARSDFESIIGELLATLDVEALQPVLGDLQAPEGLARFEPGSSSSTGQFDLLEDGLPLTTQTFLFGNMANATVGMLGLATGGLGLVAYGLGAAIALPIVALRRKHRKKMRTTSEYNRVINEALFGQEGIAKEFATELNLRIIDARESLERTIEERLVQRRRDLEQRRVETQKLLKAERQQQARARTDSEKVLAELNRLQNEAAKLRQAMRQSLAPPRKTPPDS